MKTPLTQTLRLKALEHPLLFAAALIASFMLIIAEPAFGDDYGPQPPPGFVESYLAKASGWFSNLKSKISEKIASLKSAKPQQDTAPAPDSANAVQMAGRGAPAAVHDVNGTPVQIQPALALSSASKLAVALPVPQYTLKTKRDVPALQPLAAIAEIKKHTRYAAPSEGDTQVHVPKNAFEPARALASIENKTFDPVDRLPADIFKLLHGLIAWLYERDDIAAQTLHDLGMKSKTALIREKAFAFAGWLLEFKKHDAYAALALAKALQNTEANTSSQKYDNMISQSLSEMGHRSTLVKTWVAQNAHVATEKLVTSQLVTGEGSAFLTLVLAEMAYDRKAYAQARRYAQAVPAKTSWKEQARYLAAVSAFSQKDSKENLETSGRELTELFKTVEDPAVFDATAVSLGRVHFILGNYKAANQYLAQVSRDTNLFIEAAVDNAWSLLRSGDRNHAVGNMFTLHTPYFDGAYMPESYFIQSLGYQEICQFGDAMTAVKQYKQRYNVAVKGLVDFNKGGKAAEKTYYDDLVSYLTHKEYHLPDLVARELGRNPQFLRRQKAMNAIVHDEHALAVSLPNSAPALVAWADAPSKKVRDEYQKEIASYFKGRAIAMEEDLKFLTSNIALLEYEIFAGAGQNLALQGAKNFAVDEKAAAKPSREDGKEYWPYEDEIWEDELNNFRSKMIDACAHAQGQPT